VRIGLIGCGRIGARHLEAYRQLGGVDLVVSDRDEALAKEAAEQWDVQQVPAEVLLEQDLAALDVCVPSKLHLEWILAGLEAGLHVFCEKPMCLSHADAIRVRDAARRAQRNVIVGYLYRHHPSFRFAKETVDHGIIGEPHFATARLGGRGSHRPWKHEHDSGGGAVFEMMVHSLDLLSWLLGPLSEGRLLYHDVILPERDIEGTSVRASAGDCAVVGLRAGAVPAICQSDLLTPGFMNLVEVQGSNGSVLSSIQGFVPTVVYCNEPRVLFDRGHNIRSFPPVNLFQKELGQFLDVVRADEGNEWSLLESVELARFIDATIGNDDAGPG
jgi:myo-inositol 2-dehydrogenase / D-chiro-inositol 1-dehydrogenase